MLLKQNPVNIEKSDGVETTRFGIAMTPQAMELLSNKIYSDPILAVCREYIANAVDATNMITGIKRSVHITLPSTFDPTWSVRDYGPGMSPAQIMGTESNGWQGLFNTYFLSGKTDNKNAIGGFGLGCKAGFAYVKKGGAFTVTSWHSGIKTVYACHRDSSGFPSVSIMVQEQTTEPSGMLISIPVDKGDSQMFVSRTENSIRFMECEFSFEGVELKHKPVEYKERHETWGIADLPVSSYPLIVMGGVAYPINRQHFSQPVKNLLYTSGLVIFAPVGAVELAVSRESLSYEGDTITYIEKVSTEIIAEMSQKAIEDINSQSTLFNATKTYWAYVDRNSIVKDYFNANHVTYNGQDLLYISTVPHRGIRTSTSGKYDRNIGLRFEDVDDVFYYVNVGNFNKLSERKWNTSAWVEATKKYLFVYDDGAGKHANRFRTLNALALNVDTVILVDGNKVKYDDFLKTVKTTGEHNLHKKLSEIPETKVPRKATAKIQDKVRRVGYFSYNVRYHGSSVKHCSFDLLDFGNTNNMHYYIPTYSGNYVRSFTSTGCVVDDAYTLRRILEDFFVSSRIWLIPRTYSKLVNENANFINVFDLLEALFDRECRAFDFDAWHTVRNSDIDMSFYEWLDTATNVSPRFACTDLAKTKNVKCINDIYSKSISEKQATAYERLSKLYWVLNKDKRDLNSYGDTMNIPNKGKCLLKPGDYLRRADLVKMVPLLREVHNWPRDKESIDNIATLVLEYEENNK